MNPSSDQLPFFDARAPIEKQLTAQKMNALVAYVRSLAPQMGRGMRFSRLSGGTAYTAARQIQYKHQTPFQLYAVSATGTLKVGVLPGYVNGVMPTLGGTALNSTTPPTATISASAWVWLKCVGTFGAPDTYVLTVETTTTSSPPTAEEITGTGFTSCLLIGTATVAGGVITAIEPFVSSNLGVESYGNVNNWWALQ